MARATLICSILTMALLAFALWWLPQRIEGAARALPVRQYVNRGGVTTERYPGETLDSWYARHLEAELRFAR